MAKFYGEVGYVETVESVPGVWVETVTERKYSGDIFRNSKRWQSDETLNDNLTLNNEISIIADSFAFSNVHTMRYIKWMNSSWKILNIDIQRPRIRLTIGGVYNGETTTTPDTP